MPSWEISYDHPMYMNIFRIMKTICCMLDPSNEPPSAYEVNHTATLEYALSHKKPLVLSSIFIHFRLSNEIDTRFTVVCRDITGMDWQIARCGMFASPSPGNLRRA